jgi:adenylylsulfate reductase subunit A
VVGGHGLSGYWIDSARRASLPALWAAGDVAGGSPKKYASGAWAEAVLAVRDAVEVARGQPHAVLDREELQAEQARVLAPLASPGAIPPAELEERLQKVMDEYAGGISRDYGYSEAELKLARLHLGRIEADVLQLAARTPFELLLCHDVIDRVTVAQTLVEHMLHRRETRWHCYQERLDFPARDDERFMIFVNSVRQTDGKTRIVERPVVRAEIEVELPSLADGAVIRGSRGRR